MTWRKTPPTHRRFHSSQFIVLMGPFFLPGGQNRTTKTGTEYPCLGLHQMKVLDRCIRQPRRQTGPYGQGHPALRWCDTTCRTSITTRRSRVYAWWLSKISNNMLLLGLTLNDEKKSRNGLTFARVGTIQAVEEVWNLVSIDKTQPAEPWTTARLYTKPCNPQKVGDTLNQRQVRAGV